MKDLNQWIGIDPDLRKSGVALVENGVIQSLHSLAFFDVLEFVAQHPDARVVIEDPERNRPVFNRGVGPGSQLKIAQNVGQVKAVARLMIQGLESRGVDYRAIAPLRGAVKKSAKASSAYFQRLTGWTGRSNEDQRDAALLALYG